MNMFFIGIFGIESKQKEVGYVQEIGCKNCPSKELKIYKTYDFFHFFFIPLFKWNIAYYAICKNCRAVYEIPREKGEGVEKGYKDVLSYWDLKQSEKSESFPQRCGSCGRTVEPNYQYCPYCGEKLK